MVADAEGAFKLRLAPRAPRRSWQLSAGARAF